MEAEAVSLALRAEGNATEEAPGGLLVAVDFAAGFLMAAGDAAAPEGGCRALASDDAVGAVSAARVGVARGVEAAGATATLAVGVLARNGVELDGG